MKPLDCRPPSRDRARPLDRVGRAVARKLPGRLELYPIERVVSSPYRRCLESVEPLAAARALEVERAEELAPDASLSQLEALLQKLGAETLVSTHREVFERLFDGRIACEKGGTWVVERRGSRLVPVEYLPPAAESRARKRAGKLARNR